MSVIQLASGATEADILNALSSLKTGGTVILPEGETIAIRSGLSVDVAQRDITIDLNGSTLQQAANVSVITGRAVHTPMAEVALSQDAVGHTTVTYANMPADLSVGSWIKVVSDDTLPGDHPDGNVPTRMGQALQIESIDGNTVTLSGTLIDQDNYRSNVRATEYVSGDLVIKNGEIAGDLSQASWNAPLVQLRGLVDAKVEDLSVHDGIGKGISVVDSVNTAITDVSVKNLLDGPGTLGIGVHSLSSSGTTVKGLYAENVTHAADANAIGNAPNTASAAYYGGDIGMSVEDGVAYATRDFAWSWHSEAVNARFEHVLAFDSHGFLMARGIGNEMIDSGGANNQRGIVFYEWGDGDARDITIDHVTLKETLLYSTIAINEPRNNQIIDSWFEAYAYHGPLNAAYGTTQGTTYVRIDPNNQNDIITGSTSGDLLLGGIGNDLISGGAGNDHIWGGAGIDTLFGGEGRDRFSFHDMSEAGDVIADFETGLQGDMIDLSVLKARMEWSGDDLIAAGHLRWIQSGNDVLVQVNDSGIGSNFTTLVTLADTDAASLSAANFISRLSDGAALRPMPTDGEVVDGIRSGTEGADVLYADAQARHLKGLAGNDLLYADAGGDARLEGGSGNDALIGNRGNDFLDGGSGDDWMGGGAGNDTYIVDSAGDVVSEGVNAGYDTIRTAIQLSGPLADNVEALTLLGSLRLSATGNELDNVLTGNIAANTISGGDGDDIIDGGAGHDTLYGDAGNDRLEGGAGHDRLFGGIGDDILRGGDGDDHLYGGEGNDVLEGGAGADVLSGSYGYDTVTYARASQGVIADLANSENNAGGAAGDLFSSIENLTGSVYGDNLRGHQANNILDGGKGNDRLYGMDGNDTIFGGDGNDFIDGGARKDILTGGAGDDIFYFASLAEAGDTITDFSQGDVIALSATGFGITSISDISFVAGETPRATGANACILYDTSTGRMVWDADGGDSGKPVLLAVLEGAPQVGLQDLLVI